MRAWVLALVVLTAGCMGSGPSESGPVEPSPVDPGPVTCTPQHFAEPAQPRQAMPWVEAIVYEAPGVLRPRGVEDLGHDCTADWLQQALTVDGWSLGRSTFTGADYMAIADKGAAGFWADRCGSEDKEALPAFSFDNLWAFKEGGDKLLILAAHWDAKEDAYDGGRVPAANDGASGMGVLLAMQRTIAAQDLSFPFDVAIVFFDGEDGFDDCHPLAGSLHFSRTKTLDADRLILLDMVGDAAARFPRESNSVGADPALVDLIWSKAAAHGLGDNFVDTERGVTDDHIPFIEDGVPAVDIIDYDREGSYFPPYWHTSGDTPDKLSAAMMDNMQALLLDVLADPAFVADWPA